VVAGAFNRFWTKSKFQGIATVGGRKKMKSYKFTSFVTQVRRHMLLWSFCGWSQLRESESNCCNKKLGWTLTLPIVMEEFNTSWGSYGRKCVADARKNNGHEGHPFLREMLTISSQEDGSSQHCTSRRQSEGCLSISGHRS